MLQPYASLIDRSWYWSHRVLCGLILLFLMLPVLVIIPLSFNSGAFWSTRCRASPCAGTRSSLPRRNGRGR